MSEQSNDSKDKLRYSVTYEVDKDFLCDQETIDEEFNGSWQEWLDFFAENEMGEVITGIGSDPLHIKVTDLELNKPLVDTDVANPSSTPTSTDTKIEAKTCSICKQDKPLSDFSYDKTNGIYKARCKACVAVYYRTRFYEQHTDKVQEQNEVYRKKNWERIKAAAYNRYDPYKNKARAAVNNAVAAGKLIKLPCENCGEVKTDFHHTDGYDKANWFTGSWLCRKHHAQTHKELRWQTTS